jgi:superfamily I DNA/RNA helicase
MTRRTAIKELEQLKQHAVQKFTDLHGGHAKAIASDSNFEELAANIDLMVAFVNLYFGRREDKPTTGKFATVLSDWVKNTLFTEEGGTAVHISTIHRFKGEEADVMFIIDSIKTDDGTMPAFMSPRSMKASVESAVNEANMCYVAWTRAKKWNIVVDAGQNWYCDLESAMKSAVDNDVAGVLDAPRTDTPNDTPTEAFEELSE